MAEESGALKILANVSDLLNKLAAPAAEQIGQLLGYKLHPYTVKNFLSHSGQRNSFNDHGESTTNPVDKKTFIQSVHVRRSFQAVGVCTFKFPAQNDRKSLIIKARDLHDIRQRTVTLKMKVFTPDMKVQWTS